MLSHCNWYIFCYIWSRQIIKFCTVWFIFHFVGAFGCFTNIVDGSELLLMIFTSSVLSSKCLFSKKTWLPDIDNQCGGLWAELSSDFGWSAGQPGIGPVWAVEVGGFSLVSRATRLGATMGHYGRPETTDFRWSVGQPDWGPLWAT